MLLGDLFFAGEQFSIVDIVMVPWFQRVLTVLKYYRHFHIPSLNDNSGSDHDEFHRLNIWYAAICDKSSYRRTVVNEEELIRNYSGCADNSATSDAAQKFRS